MPEKSIERSSTANRSGSEVSGRLLEMKNISISFPGVKALTDVDFNVKPGEIHALMGQNGAGKSTLIKVLTGVHRREAGSVLLEGREIDPRSPHEAQLLGISTVYQEVNLVPFLSVAENIFIGRQPMRYGQIDWEEINRRAAIALARLNIEVDVTEQLSAYSIAIQQMVAIARAVDISARLLILDEPTSSLDEKEVAQLFSVMRKLKSEGIGIIFVTHFLNQVYEISDRITVLRNGWLVGTYDTAQLTKLELVNAMVGKELVEFEKEVVGPAATQNGSPSEVFLKLKGMARKGSLHPVDIDFTSGEVVGLAGLLGSGRSELAKIIFGVDRADKGQVLLDGKPVALDSPQRAISCGFGFCPEDRKKEGLIPNLSVRENIILALQTRQGWARFLPRKKQEEIVERFIHELRIVTPSMEQPVKNLSGGNQQKVILARWLASNPRFLILDEPTRGIDVEAKAEIQKLILDLCRQGMSILFISSELEEVVRCSHRVTVMRDRVKIAELQDDRINEENIIQTIAEGGHAEK